MRFIDFWIALAPCITQAVRGEALGVEGHEGARLGARRVQLQLLILLNCRVGGGKIKKKFGGRSHHHKRIKAITK